MLITNETKDHYFATRKPLDTSFDKDKIENEVTDTGIQKILLAHLATKGNNPELAFSPDGIDEMNRNIKILNGGKFHQPIYKVRWYEKGEKFAVGQKGNKPQKFVEAAKGTNLFFAVFTNEQGIRSYLFQTLLNMELLLLQLIQLYYIDYTYILTQIL